MWSDLSVQWKTVFDEAWRAFCFGSTPIGAALFDKSGRLILSDRNRSREADTVNREISHAEANALRRLDTDRFNSRDAVLYTSMEPCPMCMGMILMGHIKEVRFAAYDSYCGMVHLTKTEPYYIGKNINCIYVGSDAELFQLTIQSYYELRHIERGASGKVLSKFFVTNSKAVDIAKQLYKDKTLDRLSQNDVPCAEVYDLIMNMQTFSHK
ncbi:MAG: nucleoside deaminase [Ruminococcus sp.]|nr:nucleoside deaminase [Ruminococcus sp.]